MSSDDAGTDSAVIEAWLATLRARGLLHSVTRPSAGTWAVRRTPEADSVRLATPAAAARYIAAIQRRERTCGRSLGEPTA